MRDAQPVIRSLVKRVVEGPGRDNGDIGGGGEKVNPGCDGWRPGRNLHHPQSAWACRMPRAHGSDQDFVTPAKAGVPLLAKVQIHSGIPAFAGMTMSGGCSRRVAFDRLRLSGTGYRARATARFDRRQPSKRLHDHQDHDHRRSDARHLVDQPQLLAGKLALAPRQLL